MTSEDKTGLEIEEHGTTLIVRIHGGEFLSFVLLDAFLN